MKINNAFLLSVFLWFPPLLNLPFQGKEEINKETADQLSVSTLILLRAWRDSDHYWGGGRGGFQSPFCMSRAVFRSVNTEIYIHGTQENRGHGGKNVPTQQEAQTSL